MGTQLDRILDVTRTAVARRKAGADLHAMTARAEARVPRGFRAALARGDRDHPAVIAELKRASPSRGVIREDYRPAELARGYEAGGAAALSVLTEEAFFQGSLAHLEAARDATTIPILRKDFMVDAFQLLEAKAAGADAILLIVAAHTDDALSALAAEARRWGLDVLCEAHDREEIERAVQLGFDTIGVNSRDLKTLQVAPENLIEMAQYLPPDVLRVAESGIRVAEDVERLQKAGYNAFLVGEALMREADPGLALARLLQECSVADEVQRG